jgi:ubiquinone/menaquinone biosynthesis C-methylase UbiE
MRLAIHFRRATQTFLEGFFSEGIGKYSDRLKAISFHEKSKVLDAGCGFGQWSLALAELNKSVVACDCSELRINVLNDLAARCGLQNVQAFQGTVDRLPFADEQFDALFSYSVLPLVPCEQLFANSFEF